jgi:hypothetical protein
MIPAKFTVLSADFSAFLFVQEVASTKHAKGKIKLVFITFIVTILVNKAVLLFKKFVD